MDELYRILDLKPGASLNQIKAARKELLQVWHPDRFEHNPKLAAKALEKSKEINESYEKLIDFIDSGRAYQQPHRDSNNNPGESSQSEQWTRTKYSERAEPQSNTASDENSYKEAGSGTTPAHKSFRLKLNRNVVLRYSLLFVSIVSVVFCATLLTPKVRSYLDERRSYLDDRDRWNTAVKLNTASGYRDYLIGPNVRWKTEAVKAIESLYDRAIQQYEATRSPGWNVEASQAVIKLLDYARLTQHPDVYVYFVRHQKSSLPYTDIKADKDEAQTFAELKARLYGMFPEDILRFVEGNPEASAPSLRITYTVTSGNSEYVAEDPSTDPFLSLIGPTGHRSIRLNWTCDVRIPERGTIYGSARDFV